MIQKPDWQWDEMQQVGTDYTDLKEVEAYNKRMADFRNVDAENREILTTLDLPAGASVLEIVASTCLRRQLGLKDGNKVKIEILINP